QWPYATTAVTLDNGVDNDSNGIQTGGMGGPVRSPLIQLALNQEPGTGGGTNQEMSVDFGFCASLTIGDLVWSDNDGDGQVDAGEAGVPGAQVAVFRSTDNVVNNGNDTQVGGSVTTGADGKYSFSGLENGFYYVRLTPPVTHPRVSATATGTDNGVNNDNNGVSQTTTGAPIYSGIIRLSALTEPGNINAPFGGNTDNSVDFGLHPAFCSLGNLVFKDLNNDGNYDSGEGVGNVLVQLYNSGGAFVASTLTSADSATRGRYFFNNLVPGSYRVHIPASQFGVGMPLVNTISITPALPLDDQADDSSATCDNGVDDAAPAVNGISSAFITLADSAEPVNAGAETGAFNTLDDTDDGNGDLTVDFGFRASGVGNTNCYHFFFSDVNLDGTTLERLSEWTPDQPYDFPYTAGPAQVLAVDMIY
ncbi:MAG: SdrD B-like domain-containing protein, partial [Gemmatimonas sp.]